MISFIYEGDIARLGGGVIIDKVLKKSLFYKDFHCDLYLNNTKYPCSIHVPVYGGYEIKNIENEEVLDYIYGKFKENFSLLLNFIIRFIVKVILRIGAYSLIIFNILMFNHLPLHKFILSVAVSLIFEYVLYIISGVLNRI